MALVTIVVPVYHNASSLADLHREFDQLARRNPKDRFEFVFVDDGSSDPSFAVLSALASKDERVRVVRLSRNFGSSAALLAGLLHARGDVVGAISADLQDPPELFDRMLDLWRQGSKVVLASREGRDDPGLTALAANIFYSLFRRFAIKTMPKGGFDFFLIDRKVCALIAEMKENNAYVMGQILWLGFDPEVVTYHRRERPERYGRSMWTFAKKVKYFIDSFVAFSFMPVMAASLLGILMSILGGLYAVVVVFVRLFWEIRFEGWASLMIVQLVVSGVQLMMMGILGEYIWRNLEETRRRPRFVVDQVVGGESVPIGGAKVDAEEPIWMRAA